MKKISAIFFSLFVVAALFCLGSCSGVSGNKLSGETNAYNWTLNTKSHTLTLEGKQPEDKPDLSPGPWELTEAREIEHIVLKGKSPYFVPDDKLKTLENLKT